MCRDESVCVYLSERGRRSAVGNFLALPGLVSTESQLHCTNNGISPDFLLNSYEL